MTMMQTLETPLPKDAQLSSKRVFESLGWSMIWFWFACCCSVDWDVAGPLDWLAPMMIDVCLVGNWQGQVSDKALELVCHEKEYHKQ